MRKAFTLTAGLLLFSCLSPVYAKPFDKFSFIFGGDIGIVSTDLPDLSLTGDGAAARYPDFAPVSQYQRLHPMSWGLHAGMEFPQTQHFSVGGEGGYQKFGPSEYRTVNSSDAQEVVGPVGKRDIRLSALSALLTMRYQWDDGVNVFAKAGPARVLMEIRQSNIYSSRNPSLSDSLYNVHESLYTISPEIVLGVGFRFHHYVNIYASFTHINGDSPNGYDAGDDDKLSVPGRTPKINVAAIGASVII